MKNNLLRRMGAAFLVLSLFLTLSLPVFAADGDADSDEPEKPVAVESITLDKTTLELELKEGSSQPTETLTATIVPENATETEITWTASASKVVSISPAKGKTVTVTGLAPGDAIVTARVGGKSISCKVAVLEHATDLELEVDATGTVGKETTLTLKDGEVTWLKPHVKPDTTTDQIVWTVDNKGAAIIEVNEKGWGLVKALKPGEVTVTATANDAVKATCKITVTKVPVTGIALDRTAISNLEVKDIIELRAAVSPSNASNQTVTWTSEPADAVSIKPDDTNKGQTAEITALKTGTVIITATVGEADEKQSATCTVNIIDSSIPDKDQELISKVKCIKLEPSAAQTLIVGNTLEFTATAYRTEKPTENKEDIVEDVKILWRSDNTGAATVTADEENGNKCTVKAVAAATKPVAITAYINGSIVTAECAVTVKPEAEPISELSFSPNRIEFAAKDAQAVELKQNLIISPTAAMDMPVEWKIIDESNSGVTVITLGEDDTGAVTPVAPGEVTVRASSAANEAIYADCTVAVSGIRLSLGSDADRKALDSLEIAVNKMESLAASYFGAASNGSIQWSSSDNAVVSVSSGRLTARALGSATITVTRNGYPATCEVTVVENLDGVTKGEAEAGKPFDIKDILTRLNQAYRTATGSTNTTLSYITSLAVSTDQGVLYYNYVSPEDPGQGVGSTDKYYYSESVQGERYISGLTFVPNPTFSGAASIRYTGYGPNREMYSGTIVLNVEALEDVTYSTVVNTPVTFKATDFNDICKVRTGRELSYVTFTLPLPQQGALYYNYAIGSLYAEKATSTTQYYRDRSPSVGEVSFLPADNYAGTVTISYRGVDTSGASFNGEVTVRIVNRDGVGVGDVNYQANQGEPVTFKASDFNSVCRTAIGETLDYIRFTLPASSAGILYYNYQGNGNYGSAVKADDRYYRSGSPAIEDVTFVPASGGSSPVTIAFSGYGSRGTRFDGTIVIQYTETSNGNAVTYTIRSGRYVRFDVADFNELCQSVTGGALNYLQFSLPPTNLGSLYYAYDATRDTYAAAVSSSSSYYRTGRNLLIDNVSFVAAQGYTGTVEIPFTGRGVGNRSFNGMVRIQVLSPSPEPLRYTTISSPVALSAADFSRACSRVLTGQLSYIQFTSLPTPAAGTMYSGYSGLGTGAQAAVGMVYYASGSPSLDQLSFVPKAGFEGTVTFEYTAQDVNGGWVHGTGEIVVSNSGTSYFLDLGTHVWAAPAVDFLYQTGVVNGISPTKFGPGDQIRRCDFALMLCRAFRFDTGSVESFPDVDPNSYYAKAVATARALGITTGDNGYFRPEKALTRQDAMVMVRRAMLAAGWNLGISDHSYLSGFSDSPYIAMYARDAVASMVQLGIVNGSAGLLNPQEEITRAEMAVILHRVLTL